MITDSCDTTTDLSSRNCLTQIMKCQTRVWFCYAIDKLLVVKECNDLIYILCECVHIYPFEHVQTCIPVVSMYAHVPVCVQACRLRSEVAIRCSSSHCTLFFKMRSC